MDTEVDDNREGLHVGTSMDVRKLYEMWRGCLPVKTSIMESNHMLINKETNESN